jgi:protein phosphatase
VVAGDEVDDVERMTIGEFAERAGLTPKALRLYDDMGLLAPAEVDGETGYRFYEPAQLDRARLVARLRLVGMPLARIRQVADLTPAAAAAEVTSYWRQVEADTRTRHARVVTLVEELRAKETTMTTTGKADVAGALAQGRRDAQQDALHLGEDLWVVADGYGDGRMALAAVAAFVEEPTNTDHDPVAALDAAVGRAHGAVEALGQGDSAGTTLTAVRLLGDQAAIVHLGDSRAWLSRAGELKQLTRDHTEVQSLIDDGALTEEEALSDPRRGFINRAVAQGLPAEADTALVRVGPGDRPVLTTDGIHEVLAREDLASLTTGGTAQECVDRVAAAVEEEGARDNYAVIVVDLPVD